MPIDPNNFPLNSLVANEHDQVDVNFIPRHNFNKSAYKNNFGGNNYGPYPNNNGNSYGNAYINPKSSTSDLENMLKEFISSQNNFNKMLKKSLLN